MKTININTYTFDELSKEVQEHLIEKNRKERKKVKTCNGVESEKHALNMLRYYKNLIKSGEGLSSIHDLQYLNGLRKHFETQKNGEALKLIEYILEN